MTPPITVAKIRVERITFHPLNIRRDLGDLRDLTASISRFGVMQPITVEQHGQQFRLRAGHRRTAAARIADVATIPAVIHAQPLDDDEFVMQALHENIVRRGLDHAERRNAIRALLDLGCTAEGIGRDLGVTGQTIRRWADHFNSEGARVKVSGKRVNVTALRHIVNDWRDRAQDGLTAEQAHELIGQLETLAAGRESHLQVVA